LYSTNNNLMITTICSIDTTLTHTDTFNHFIIGVYVLVLCPMFVLLPHLIYYYLCITSKN